MKIEVPKIEVAERVELPADKTALIIIDMQNDFVHEKGRLYVAKAKETIGPIRRLLENARKHKVMTIFTKDTHYPGDPEFKIWGEHALKSTWGWEIIDELKPLRGEIIIEKTRYDAFYGTPLDDLLRAYNISNLIIVGTVANICVLHTVAGAALRWYRIYVPIDSISALNEFDYYVALRQISFLYQGVLVKKAESVSFKGEGKWSRE